MRAGLLRNTIFFEEPSYDDFALVESWHKVISTRAQVKLESMNQVTDNGDMWFPTVITFTIRNTSKIHERMRIGFNGAYYRILSIFEDEFLLAFVIKTEKIND